VRKSPAITYFLRQKTNEKRSKEVAPKKFWDLPINLDGYGQ